MRRLGETMDGLQGSKEYSARLGAGEGETGLPVLVFLEQFRRTAAQINRDVLALQEANERVASGAQDQSEAVSRTATSVEALSDRIDRISRNAGEAADACERARQEAHQGLEQVNSVIEGMDRLLTRIEANGRKVRRLGDRSTEIGVIVELIRGISSRTDMLALNATIESIRAGEHGRGFAIVAEEIRKLAERAAAATSEIGTLVDAIQADTQESIQALSEEQAETQRESQRVRETGSSLARISQVVEKSARLVDGISRSTNDQVLTTQELVRAMQRISDVTQQTQERTTQARAFIKALNQSCGPGSAWPRRSRSGGFVSGAHGRGSPCARRVAAPERGSPNVPLERRFPRSLLSSGLVSSRGCQRPARSRARGNRQRALAMKPPSHLPLRRRLRWPIGWRGSSNSGKARRRTSERPTPSARVQRLPRRIERPSPEAPKPTTRWAWPGPCAGSVF